MILLAWFECRQPDSEIHYNEALLGEAHTGEQ